MMDLFSGREGVHAQQIKRENGSVAYETVGAPLTADLWIKHLRGELTLGCYLVRTNSTVKTMVVDIDISKKKLIEILDDAQQKETLLQKTHLDAVRILTGARKMGIECYIEDSGNRGRHCWFFFAEPVMNSRARQLAQLLAKTTGLPTEDITWEFSPGSLRIKPGKYGPLVKLPFGVHLRSGNRSCFLNEHGQVVEEPFSYLRQVKKIAAATLNMILSDHQKESGYAALMEQPALPEATGQIKLVLDGCSVLRYLINKAESTNYLTHRERIILLQTLGLLDEEGQDYLRKIMKRCINYNYAVTERYISKVMSKPISCPRIREDMISVSAALRCDCNFQRMPGDYPSPVLYAKGPWSRPKKQYSLVSSAQTEGDRGLPPDAVQVEDESSIFIPEIEQLMDKMAKLRRHQHGIENSLQRCAQRLDQIFDQLHTDQLLTKVGKLTREKINDEITWSIKL